jgi:predicted GNAT family acetyltransferase
VSSLYAEYIKEREGSDIVEIKNDDGWHVAYGTYKQIEVEGEKAVYLVDVYVKPDSREQGLCAKIVSEVELKARAQDCPKLLTSLDSRANGATRSLKVILGCGFELKAAEGPMLWFDKKVEI